MENAENNWFEFDFSSHLQLYQQSTVCDIYSINHKNTFATFLPRVLKNIWNVWCLKKLKQRSGSKKLPQSRKFLWGNVHRTPPFFSISKLYREWKFIFSDGKYHALPSGELLIHNVDYNDKYQIYRCKTINRLTKEIVLSSAVSIRLLGK